MTEPKEQEENIDRASFILNRLGLTWDDIEGKDVLDVGTGKAVLPKAAVLRSSKAKISSIDIDSSREWLSFPWEKVHPPVQAEAERLPFKNGSFDYVLMHATASDEASVNEAVRVLKPGGELRIFPTEPRGLDQWYMARYLMDNEDMTLDQINMLLDYYNKEIDENDGWIPNEYKALYDKVIDTLTKDEKLQVLKEYIERYKEYTGVDFQYHIKDLVENQPNALLIYKKR